MSLLRQQLSDSALEDFYTEGILDRLEAGIEKRETGSLKPRVRPVAHGAILRMLASAEREGPFLCHLHFDWVGIRALVGTVAEGLTLG